MFLMNCRHYIKAMDDMGLLTHFCGHHITGHSLGGALANLVAAKPFICQPTHMQSRLPITPSIISFNAPGIGHMPDVCTSSFCESQVISMRAQYDCVSDLGDPYGYVVNTILPEGYAASKKAFALERNQENYGKISGLMSTLPGLSVTGKEYEAVQHGREAYQARHLLDQHSIINFLKVIRAQNDALAISFNQIRLWAQHHGGQNHDLKAVPIWGKAVVPA